MYSTTELNRSLDIIGLALKAKDTSDVEAIWLQLQILMPITGLLLSTVKPTESPDTETPFTMYFGLPENWMLEYVSNQYFQRDPVVRMARNTNKIFSWNDAYSSSTGASTDFMFAAAQHGLTEGYAMGKNNHRISRRSSVCSVSVEEELSLPQQNLLAYVLPHINEIVCRPGFTELPYLTNREVEVIRLAADGYNYKEIAEHIGFTPRTSKFHLSNIYKKLKVDNKFDAIHKVTLAGLIPPSSRGI